MLVRHLYVETADNFSFLPKIYSKNAFPVLTWQSGEDADQN